MPVNPDKKKTQSEREFGQEQGRFGHHNLTGAGVTGAIYCGFMPVAGTANVTYTNTVVPDLPEITTDAVAGVYVPGRFLAADFLVNSGAVLAFLSYEYDLTT